MSLDRSLKGASGLAGHRNVLTRDERINKLKEKGAFDPAKNDPLHLPKVGNRKVGGAKVKKEDAADGATPAAGAAAPAAAASAKGAAPAKAAAAPAKDAKKK